MSATPAKAINLAPLLKIVGALLAGALAGAGGNQALSPAEEPLVCPPCPAAPVAAPPAPSPESLPTVPPIGG